MKWSAAAVAMAAGLFGAQAVMADSFDMDAAREVYLDQCFKCHGKIEADPTARGPSDLYIPAVALPYGPTLAGVYGRKAGAIEDFKYSKAFLDNSDGVVWDGETLDQWLSGTQQVIPGTVMFYAQPDETMRATIIRYLKETTERLKQ